MARKRGKRGGAQRHRKLKQGAQANSATDAARPMPGTARRGDEPGGAMPLAGNDSVGGPVRDRKGGQSPRREDAGRNRSSPSAKQPPKRGFWSRLNPFSRH